MEQQDKQWIELSGIAIKIVVTGQEDVKDEEQEGQDAEEED